jgi:hypothetical protein
MPYAGESSHLREDLWMACQVEQLRERARAPPLLFRRLHEFLYCEINRSVKAKDILEGTVEPLPGDWLLGGDQECLSQNVRLHGGQDHGVNDIINVDRVTVTHPTLNKGH